MATKENYALISILVYNRSDSNKINNMNGWSEVIRLADEALTGFSAGAYMKGGEIVIAFAGTNESKWKDTVFGSIPGAMGLLPAQTAEAARLVASVMKNYPGASISFAGHSLGGGLASQMAVFFDRPAMVFDHAPFELSARNPDALKEIGTLLEKSGIAIPKQFMEYIDRGGLNFSSREHNVQSESIKGEFLESIRSILPTIQNDTKAGLIDLGVQSASRFDLHSITLLHMVLLSNNLKQALSNQPKALEIFMDKNLYARDFEAASDADFMVSVLNGYFDKNNDALNKLATDLEKIKDIPGEMDDGIVKGLLATLVEYYYHESDGDFSQFFTRTESGIQFDLSSIPLGSDGKGVALLLPELRKKLASLDITSSLLEIGNRDRISLSFNSASLSVNGNGDSHRDVMIAIDSAQGAKLSGGGGDDLLIGAMSGQDILDGGEGNDVLIAGLGGDLLDGGTGNDILHSVNQSADTLIGGAGADTYYVGAKDTIIESGKDSVIYYGSDKTKLTGGILVDGMMNLWRSSDGLFLYARTGKRGEFMVKGPEGTFIILDEDEPSPQEPVLHPNRYIGSRRGDCSRPVVVPPYGQ